MQSLFSDSKANTVLAESGIWPMTTSKETEYDPPMLGMVIDFYPQTMRVLAVCPVEMIQSYN
jgi:hypothetical protein